MSPIEIDKMENIALDEDFVHDQLPSVEEYKAQHAVRAPSWKRKVCFAVILVVTFATILFGTAVGVLVNNKFTQPDRLQRVMSFVGQHSATDAFARVGTPQHRAAQWMALEDPKQLPLNSRFLQRYALMVFWYSTGGESTWAYDLNVAHPRRDECHWNREFPAKDGTKVTMGVVCNPGEKVVELVISK